MVCYNQYAKKGDLGGIYEDTLEEMTDWICNFCYSNRMLWIRR